MKRPDRSAATLVLVPGLMCDSAVWEPVRAPLEVLANLYVADYGDCDSLPAMARSVLEAAPERFALAGHSMGGRVALEVVNLAPDRVIALALLDTGVESLPPGEAGARETAHRMALLDRARLAGTRAMAELWVQGMVHPRRLDDAPFIEAILAMFGRKDPERFAAQVRALLARPDRTSLLPTIRSPTLVLCGAEDSWAPAAIHQSMSQAIPGSRLTIVPDCGHMAPMEQPGSVGNAHGCLASVGAPGTGALQAPPARTPPIESVMMRSGWGARQKALLALTRLCSVRAEAPAQHRW